MNTKINKENILQKMEGKNIKVVSIDKENKTWLCDDGIEYPLMDGCENFSIDEMQHFVDEAKNATINIIKGIVG